MTKQTRRIAVLTGDLVNSTALGPEKTDRAMQALAQCAGVQEAWHGAPLHFTRNRGDGWQVVLARPEMALRSALAFRAALKSQGAEYDTYIGIAIGAVDTPLPSDLNDATGHVFTESGSTLDVLKQSSDAGIRMDLSTAFSETGGPNAAAVILADQVSQKWTQPQSKAMLYMLDPTQSLSYTQLAKFLGISRQAVTKSLDAAAEKPIDIALGAIEQEGHAGV